MKIDHIGYVTKDIKKKSRYFTNTLGYKVLTSKIIEPRLMMFRFSFFPWVIIVIHY